MPVKKKTTKAEDVIRDLIFRGINWYDYSSPANKQNWATYKADADYILNSEVFNNELSHYVADLVKFIAYEAKDMEQVHNTRTAIVALETFRERLKSIDDPDTRKSNENPHEAI